MAQTSRLNMLCRVGAFDSLCFLAAGPQPLKDIEIIEFGRVVKRIAAANRPQDEWRFQK